MKNLNSNEGDELKIKIDEAIKTHLIEIDLKVGVESWAESHCLLDMLKEARTFHLNSNDEVHNDIFILESYVRFFRAYGRLWREISKGNYSDSWSVLQDANDDLRIIRKFSKLTLGYFAEQLSELELIYPYNIFSSAAFVVERFECSVCGNDIDSFECLHRKGELYRGEMAYGIAKNILDIDHIAFVENPVDKRCVFMIPDEAPGFSGVRYLGNALNKRIISVSNFGGVEWSKKMVPSAQYVRLGRNELCHCKSGKKFKRCCINKKFVEARHGEFLPVRSIFKRSGLV